MPQTATYNFDEDIVTNAIQVIGTQHQEGVDQANNIRNVVKPLVDGDWIGVAAQAFFASNEEFLKLAETLNEDITTLFNDVNQALSKTLDTVQKIDAITAR
ncbi:MAG: WXG100 family type VII secretion target [Anaerolineae bacterium]|nr:WXG100 family type VII secretion target [Anaerolineae bacterium]